MRFTYAREAVAAAWIFALCSIGFAAHVTSVSGWTVLAALAMTSIVILQRLWSEPAQTMSECIQEARG